MVNRYSNYDVNIKNNKPVWSNSDVYNKYQDIYNPKYNK